MNSKHILLILIVIFSQAALSQQRTLTLYGLGDITRPADQAELTFTVQKDGESLRLALLEAQNYLAHIHHDLLVIGLDSTCLQQSRVRVDEKNMAWFTSHKFRAVLRTRIVVGSITLLDTLLDVLSKYEIEEMSEIRFTLKNPQSLGDQAYAEALNNAKRSAADIAKAQGLTLGDVISVEEELNIPDARGGREGDFVGFRGGRMDEFSFMRATSPYATYFPEQIRIRRMLKVNFAVK